MTLVVACGAQSPIQWCGNRSFKHSGGTITAHGEGASLCIKHIPLPIPRVPFLKERKVGK